MEGEPTNPVPETVNHEPVKMTTRTNNGPTLGLVYGGLQEVVTKEVTEEVAETIGSKLFNFSSKALGLTLGLLLTDTMSPNFGGITSEMPFPIDIQISSDVLGVEESFREGYPNLEPNDEAIGDDDSVTLYKGVSADAKNPKMFTEALHGVAIPNGLRFGESAHTDPGLHAAGDNYSIWTSWSTERSQAKTFARGTSGKSNGVILSKKFKRSTVMPNISLEALLMQEEEWLVPGVVSGANVEPVPAGG